MLADYQVHKFGGSSFVDANGYKTVAARLNGQRGIIIVSALKGTTSALQDLLDQAKSGLDITPRLQALTAQHNALIDQTVPSQQAAHLKKQLHEDIAKIQALLYASSLVMEYSPTVQAAVIGYGEQWSARLLTALLGLQHNTLYLNAVDVLCSYETEGVLYINWEESTKKLASWLKEKIFDQLVITGFLACDENGKQTTLGRNGSDYSAAIFAKLFHANALFIWKDVDGIFSADPARVRSAFALSKLSYECALELAYFGACVLHPKAIEPAVDLQIPIYIKNTFNPSAKGTLISSEHSSDDMPVQGITSIDHIAMITVEGAGMIGVSGTAMRVFQVLQQLHISIILISQASSEHSICFAIQEAGAEKACKALRHALKFEIQQNQIKRIVPDTDCAILAIVGDGMVGHLGITGKLSTTLANAGINIKAIAQGSSERNISIVVPRNKINKALNAVHAGFYLSKKTLSIGIIGPGLVGGTLLKQINEALDRLHQHHQTTLTVRGICNSKNMLLSHDAIELGTWQENLAKSSMKTDLNKFIEHIVSDDMPHSVIIDCTSSPDIASQYASFIARGAHVITPNKRANSEDYAAYTLLKSTAKKYSKHYLYETTVCAGLPVMTTLNDILQTGDQVLEIQGVVSGTLSYVFNEFSKGISFSDIIKKAKQLGYTEPDPRDDLTGMDVARKMVILARELGFPATLDHVAVTNLVPEILRHCSTDDFMNQLAQYDELFAKNIRSFAQQDEQVAYAGVIDAKGSITVGIKSVDTTHPFSRLNGTDNILIFRTRRYNSLPLVIQGPGAGAEVTAAGVFADLLRLVSYI